MTNNTANQIIEKIKSVPLNDVRIVREYHYSDIISYPTAELITECYVVWQSGVGDTIEAKITFRERNVVDVRLNKTNPNAESPTHMKIGREWFMNSVGVEYLNALLVRANSAEIKDKYKSFV